MLFPCLVWMNENSLANWLASYPPSSTIASLDADSPTSCFSKSFDIMAPFKASREPIACQTRTANLPRFHCHRPPLSFPGCPLCKSPVAAEPPSTFFGKPEGRHTNPAERRKGRVLIRCETEPLKCQSLPSRYKFNS